MTHNQDSSPYAIDSLTVTTLDTQMRKVQADLVEKIGEAVRLQFTEAGIENPDPGLVAQIRARVLKDGQFGTVRGQDGSMKLEFTWRVDMNP